MVLSSLAHEFGHGIRLGDTVKGHQRPVVTRQVGAEVWRAVYEVRPGKRNRSLALISLLIKK